MVMTLVIVVSSGEYVEMTVSVTVVMTAAVIVVTGASVMVVVAVSVASTMLVDKRPCDMIT